LGVNSTRKRVMLAALVLAGTEIVESLIVAPAPSIRVMVPAVVVLRL